MTRVLDVLLIFADPVRFPPAFPYGRDIVAAELRKAGLGVEVVSPYMARNPAGVVRDACRRFRPKITGFSFRNLDTAGFSYSDDGEQNFIQELSQLVREAASAGGIVALGGSGFSIAPNDILAISGADIGFIGSSEADFATFCKRIVADGLTCADMPHKVWRAL